MNRPSIWLIPCPPDAPVCADLPSRLEAVLGQELVVPCRVTAHPQVHHIHRTWMLHNAHWGSHLIENIGNQKECCWRNRRTSIFKHNLNDYFVVFFVFFPGVTSQVFNVNKKTDHLPNLNLNMLTNKKLDEPLQEELEFIWTFNSSSGLEYLRLPVSQFSSPSPASSVLIYHVVRCAGELYSALQNP